MIPHHLFGAAPRTDLRDVLVNEFVEAVRSVHDLRDDCQPSAVHHERKRNRSIDEVGDPSTKKDIPGLARLAKTMDEYWTAFPELGGIGLDAASQALPNLTETAEYNIRGRPRMLYSAVSGFSESFSAKVTKNGAENPFSGFSEPFSVNFGRKWLHNLLAYIKQASNVKVPVLSYKRPHIW